MLVFDKQLQIYEIALKEDGVSEMKGPHQNPRILEYHSTTLLKANDEEVSWCSSFLNWCCLRAKVIGTNSAAARSWLKWGQIIKSPQVGDFIILKRGDDPKKGHCGIYQGIQSGLVKVFGGNQQNKVCSMHFNADHVLGYRRYYDPNHNVSQ